MKLIYISALLATLAGYMTATDDMADAAMPGADASQAITTEAQFREAVVGKTLTFQGNTFAFNDNGTLSGPWDGRGITGNWTWENGAACRRGAIGSRVLELDCQVWVVEGSTATVTRDRRNGASFVYEIN
ncbi:hypothetical protein AN191_17690 [Loktanella sp. 5RATIMAR09]|uniref:hypothetical protein n=1 Tax=Loktanella sp. 5RATIMAR09 TaxID=1225655 RepID=UPI0006EBA19A|nr:hypothetical protein [Loktanella sp. 5RATIMAR09]KQI70541.1 hypothetical protein AN191_17690 [Loktanella sp. 5RATIMAR09]